MQQIPLEEKDLKKLEVNRRFMIILFFVSIGLLFIVLGFAYYHYFEDQQSTGLALLGFSAFIIFGLYAIYNYWKNIKADCLDGIKEIVQGKITNKVSYKGRRELTINEKRFVVSTSEYDLYYMGQSMLIARAPNSNIVLDMRAMDEEQAE